MEQPVFFQDGQQQAAKRHLAGGDKNGAVLQSAAFGDLRLARLDVLHGDPNMVVQPLPLRGQLHAPAGTGKQGTAQFPFQIFDRPGQVGLVVQQHLGGLRDIPIFGNIVKDSVAVVADVHFDRLFCM